MENWKPVVGFELAYEVSDLGNLRSLDRELSSGRWGHTTRKGQPIIAKISHEGRAVVGLRLNGKRTWRGVHALVCEAFHGPKPSPKHQVAHFPDRNPLNNTVGNLRWATALENHADRRIHETTFPGEKNYFAKLTEQDVRDIRRLYRPGRPCHPGNQRELAERFGICAPHVGSIANGKAWAHIT
jgi:hypothetical protein